jgi:hypothetical protein
MRGFLVALVILFLTAGSLLANDVYRDFDQAVRAMAIKQKPMMAVIMQTTCPYCKEYWQNTINAPGVINKLSQEFVIYESYLDKGGVFPSDFPWTGTVPTTYFISPNGELVGEPLVGVIPLNQFYTIRDGSRGVFP